MISIAALQELADHDVLDLIEHDDMDTILATLRALKAWVDTKPESVVYPGPSDEGPLCTMLDLLDRFDFGDAS